MVENTRQEFEHIQPLAFPKRAAPTRRPSMDDHLLASRELTWMR